MTHVRSKKYRKPSVRVPGRRSGRASAVLLLAFSLLADPALAQVEIGPEFTYQTELRGGSFGAGARARADLGLLLDGLGVIAYYDRFFEGCDAQPNPFECSLWESGGALTYSAGPAYLGTGASFQRLTRTGGPVSLPPIDDWAFNILVGLSLPQVPIVTPFVEFRMEIASDTHSNQQTFAIGAMIGPESLGRRGRAERTAGR